MLTSEEMIALCRVFAILHYTICLPMRFLTGNNYSIGAEGYDWSIRLMGNAIDALEEAMIEIETDGSKLLSEDFMGNIFSNIYKYGPLEPPTEFIDRSRRSFSLSSQTTISEEDATVGHTIKRCSIVGG